MMKKTIMVLLSLSFLFLSGCQSANYSICTTSYPIQYIVERIAGSHVKVCNIAGNEVAQVAQIDPNFQELLKGADALFYIKDYEPYFAMYSEDIKNTKVNAIDISSKIFSNPFGRYTQSSQSNAAQSEVEPYYTGKAFQNINEYLYDPFVWMDPIVMLGMSESIYDYLCTTYPEFTDDFTANYNELDKELTVLDANYQVLKDKLVDVSFVSITPSFGNWQSAFHINVYPVVLSKYGALPNQEQLALIKQRIKDDHVTYIAQEPNLPQEMQDLYDQLVSELGLIPVPLSGVSSFPTTENEKSRDYFTIMYDNLKTLESMVN